MIYGLRPVLMGTAGDGSGAGGDLASVIEQSIKEVDGKIAEGKKDGDGKVVEMPKPEEKKDDKVVSPADQLWAALQDPNTAETVVAAMAAKLGYTKAETKELKEEVAQAIEDDDEKALIEALGDDFSTFAKKLTPALKKIVERGVDAKTKDLRESASKADVEKTTMTVNQAIKDLATENFKTDKLTPEQETELTRLTKKYQPTKGQTPHEYLTDLFKLLPKGQPTQRQEQIRSDAGSRLASGAGGNVEGKETPRPSGSMSLEDAAFAAAESLAKKP